MVVGGSVVVGWLVVGCGVGAAGGRATAGGVARRRAGGRWCRRGRTGRAWCRVGFRFAGTGGGGAVAPVVELPEEQSQAP